MHCQEIAYAIMHNKPVVILVLDQEAWDIITVPSGAKTLWETTSSSAIKLRDYEGSELIPEQKFSLHAVEALVSHMSSVNLCPCRQLEEVNWGWEALLAHVTRYVLRDLIYYKEHAELKGLAERWEQRGRRGSMLLHRKLAESWDTWLVGAVAMRSLPVPTPIMREFVSRSLAISKRNRAALLWAGSALLAMALVGMAASGVMLRLQQKATAEAQRQEAIAQNATARAEHEAQNAKDQAAIAFKASQAAIARLLPQALRVSKDDTLVSAAEIRLYIAALK